MTKRSLLLVGVVVLCLVPGLTAQNTGPVSQEIGLQFEISRNGAVIARPSIVVAASGTRATVPLAGGTIGDTDADRCRYGASLVGADRGQGSRRGQSLSTAAPLTKRPAVSRIRAANGASVR